MAPESDPVVVALIEAEMSYRDQWRLLPRNAAARGPYLAFEARLLGREPKPEQLRAADILTMNPVHGCASVLSPALAGLALPFPRPAPHQYHDQWLALMAASASDLEYSARQLVRYTIHQNQVAGLGLRRLRSSFPKWFASVRRPGGLRRDLLDRTAWVTLAARQAAERSHPAEGSQPYAAGRLDRPTARAIASSVIHRNAPIARGILLAAGYLIAGRASAGKTQVGAPNDSAGKALA